MLSTENNIEQQVNHQYLLDNIHLSPFDGKITTFHTNYVKGVQEN